MFRLSLSVYAIAALAFVLAVGGVAYAQTATLTANPTTLNPAGGTITFTFTAAFAGTAIVGLDVLAPGTWVYQPGTDEPPIKPAVGAASVLDWTDYNQRSSPVGFTFGLTYPAGTIAGSVMPSAILRPIGGTPSILLLATINLSSGASPTITAQPVSQSVYAGSSTTFAVTATDTAPITYQWLRASVPISGATAATLTLKNVQSTDAGGYAVTVGKSTGSVTSNVAILTTITPPTVMQQPVSVAVAAGAGARFSVTASGNPPLTYQWRKDGANLSGATGDSFSLASVGASDAGSYSVIVTNAAGFVTGGPARLDVGAALNFTVQPVDQTIPAGGAVSFTVAASGGGGAIAYQWRKNGTAIPGATLARLTIANVQPADAGGYTVVLSNSAGTVMSNSATLTVIYSRLSNLSVRANLDYGQTLTVGFVTSGTKQLLARAIGPGLVPFGITSGFVSDPKMALMSQATGVTVAQNDDWGSGLAVAFAGVGAFPLEPGSKDAGLLQPVNGPHTVQVNGIGAGLILVEVYDAENASPARLTNVSARSQVGTGANILIAGFVLNGTADRTLLIRGIGPALQALFGVNGALADPKLEIFRQDNTKIIENDDWNASLAPTSDQVGAFRLPIGSKDAAVLVVLQPGAYTAQLSGVGGTTGDGVIEVYEVP